jgi:DNA-binding beta-propeller fold protein YncE
VAVLDAEARRLITTIPMGGEVGNTQYDPVSGRIWTNAEGRDELVGIDPASDKIVSRDHLAGCRGNHGLLIDAPRRLALVACEDNARVIAFSLDRHAKLAELPVGRDPDVLAYDPGPGWLYVAGEGGVVSVFRVGTEGVSKVGEGFLGDNAHVVAADPTTHRVYFPLRNVAGKAVLRIMAPNPPQR